MHIPKTAGTTLRGVLEARFDPARTIPSEQIMRNLFGGHYPPIPELLKLPDEEWASAQLLRGHYPWQVMKRFPRKPVLLTMLREPIARSISHLRHVRRNAKWAAELSLSEIARNRPFVAANIANMQTRMLAMRFSMDDPGSWPKDVNHPIPINEQVFERAVVTLRSFEFVGIQEHFETSMQMMFRMFKWPLQRDFPRANSGEGEDEIKPDLLDQLAESNQYDLRLYEQALAIFRRRAESLQKPEVVPDK